MSPTLYLFDDDRARDFHPFAATRPVGELLFGALTARQRAEALSGLPCSGHLSGPGLLGFDETGAATAVASAEHPAGARILLNSRFVPAWDAELPAPRDDVLIVLVSGGQVAGWVAPPGMVVPEARLLSVAEEVLGLVHEIQGDWIESVWDLMSRNAKRIALDIEHLHGSEEAPGTPSGHPTGVHVLGKGILSLGEGVEIEPGVVLDLRSGPIRIESGVRVQAFTRLAGPAWIGPDTTLLGGSISGVSIGPRCKIRGEVEDSVILGYTNKAHDGFLGHAVLGRWVNLGAGTTNSDLKNNYGDVRLSGPSGTVDTGLAKVGCFLGDHVKTGIGTMLNTGTVIGAGSNVFGGVMPPTWVPAFSWGAGADLTPYRLDRFLAVARIVMNRRQVELTPGVEGVLERAWHDAQESAP